MVISCTPVCGNSGSCIAVLSVQTECCTLTCHPSIETKLFSFGRLLRNHTRYGQYQYLFYKVLVRSVIEFETLNDWSAWGKYQDQIFQLLQL